MILLNLYFAGDAMTFAQVVNNSYSVLIETPVSLSKNSFKLTSPILQNTLYTKSAEESEYCDFVIRCNEAGIIPARILYMAYKNSLNVEVNQRFIRFQKILEYACKQEKINLKNEKRKMSNNKRNFLLFNFTKNSFLRFK
ncbi:MAG: hypothetical protein LBE18_10620 [Planctomycetaceae bacterium]|nr:hypothetical protein [Planctomycetaceae bacterium]